MINPSRKESLSLIVFEALGMGRPVLVNSLSPVLKDLSERFRWVFSFDDVESFSKSMDFLCNIAPTAELYEEAGKVRETLAWPPILKVYKNAIL